MPAWRGTINQRVLLEGYNETSEDNRAEQKPQVGAPIRRRRSYVPTTKIAWSQILTFTEWDELQAMYDTDLKSGVLPFTRYHPRKGSSVTITAVFDKRPSTGAPISANSFLVSFEATVYG